MEFQLETLGFEALYALVRSLGPDKAGDISAALWRRLAPFNKRHARALGHLGASLPEEAARFPALLDAMWDNLGRTAAEAFHIDHLMQEQDRFLIGDDTQDAIRAAKQRGAVFVSLHQGNWELAAPLLNAHGLPVAGVYQRLRNPIVDTRIAQLRAPHYPLGLFPKGVESARRLLRVIGDGGTVTIMADLRDMSGVKVPFFGQAAPSTLFPALLARGRDVPLFAGVVLRTAGATFRIKTVEVAVARGGAREADIEATTAAIQAVFEGFIRDAPGQWMWGHRRWRR